MSSAYYHYSVDELVDVLRAKDETILQLNSELADLLKQINHEYSISKNMMDQNIQMKGQICNLENRLQVHAHPSTIEKLTAALQDATNAVEQFRSMLTFAVSKIPNTPENHSDRRFLLDFLDRNRS